MRVLLVEDDDLIASGVAAGLKAHGIHADRVADAAGAEAACAGERYDALVLDLGLPDRDGMDLLADLRRHEQGLPVVILTARLHAVVRRAHGRAVQAIQAGPLRLDALRRTLHARESESLRSAGEGVRRLRHTLDQLMALTRAEAAGGAADACDSVLGAVGDVIARTPEAGRERIRLEVSGADRGNPVPHSMLATALRNVLDNALRYGGEAPVELAVRFDGPGRRVLIEVADRGPGMSESELANAGQRFWRGAHGGEGGDGAGLGLSIVHAIVGRYHGTVELHPREGGGLLVRLALPTG